MTEEGKLIGKITHYFNKIGVAIIEITENEELKIGDEIRITGGNIDFIQKVESMQIEHQPIEKAGKGDQVGVKVKEKVKEGNLVYKIVSS